MTRGRPSNFVLLCLALIALAGGKAFMPSGWMPVASEQGIRIALCTGSGPHTAWVDEKGRLHKQQQPEENTAQDRCPFGVLAHGADLPGLPAIAPATTVERPLPAPLPQRKALARAHAPRPPTRAPPTLA